MNHCHFIDVPAIKDLLLIISSLSTILFAFLGYNKWKKELKGRTKYELARTSLKTVYSFRYAFKALRSPLTLVHEMPPGFNPRNQKPKEDEHYVISSRLKIFNEDYNNLISLLPEIELEFDKELLDLFYELCRHITNYNLSLNEYFQLYSVTNNEERFNDLRAIVRDIGKENKTSKEFDHTVEKLENQLRSILKKY